MFLVYGKTVRTARGRFFSDIGLYRRHNPESRLWELCATGGHIEAVKINFIHQTSSYRQLLDVYWRQVDPTDAGGQFVDLGHAYTTAIFYLDEEQHRLAII